MKYFGVFYICLAYFVFSGVTNAQISQNIGVLEPHLTVEPQYPAPGERVSVTVNDYSTNGNNAISWTLNGTPLPDTANARTISFVTGEAYVAQNISAKLTTISGLSTVISKTVIPKYLDIVVEPQTYTPPFYNGRALPVHNSIVRVTGLLHGQNGLVDASAHTYVWKLNNIPIDGGPRRGGFQTLYTVPHGRSHTLSLEVSDSSGQTVARRSVLVESGEVEANLYEVSPLYGLSHTVAPNPLQMIGNSLTLRAIPYNLDLRAIRDNVMTEWAINNTPVTNGSDRYEVTLDRSGFGKANVSFKVRNLESLLQGDETGVTLNF